MVRTRRQANNPRGWGPLQRLVRWAAQAQWANNIRHRPQRQR